MYMYVYIYILPINNLITNKVCSYTYTNTYTYIRTHIHIYIYTHTHTYIYIYIYVCICIYTHTGALIVTIMFAAAITVPNGNEKGLPVFLNEKLFMLFIIFDALSLLSASTSLLMFIGILTARYAEEDFLKSLLNKIIIGLSTLIFSITTMMITFCASLFIILPRKSRMLIPLVCLAGVLVVVFAWMQSGLLINMVISTYRLGIILDKKVK